MKKTIIDIGCGRYKVDGAIGVDRIKGGEEDIQHDLDDFPYPFDDSSVDIIHANHILEHVDDFIGVMHELYRIGKPGAKIIARCPHASCIPTTWADPTHKRFFVKHSFLHFHGSNKTIYDFETDLRVEKIRLHYYLYDGYRNGKRLSSKPQWINSFVNFIVNLNSPMQDLFERLFVYYIGGFEEVYYEIRIVKGEPQVFSTSDQEPSTP